MVKSDNVIINVALDYWYPKGQARLKESLYKVGYEGDILTWTNEWPKGGYNQQNAYNCKAAAFERAIEAGYKNILWLDCSVWAIKDITDIFTAIDQDGFYMIDNGYNCAQTCSDTCLKYFNVTRDNAEKMREVASGILGISMGKSVGVRFIDRFIQGCKDGAADGSRLHDNQSKDPRFLFHRQDQSVASIVLAQMGHRPNDTWGNLVEYDPKKVVPSKTVLTLQGM